MFVAWKKAVKVAFFLLLVTTSSATYNEYVNTFIGSGGHGYGVGGVPVGAQLPFGMVRLSPDTSEGENIWLPWLHTGGYYYGDTHIRMFSHTHCVGAGELDYGNIGTMPSSSLPRRIGTKAIDRYPFMQTFSHVNETAEPGYYSVKLLDENIKVELTSTMNMGAHRYTFGSANGRWIVFDISYTLKYMGCAGSELTINNSTKEVSGWVNNMGDMSSRFGGMKIFFAAKFSSPFTLFGVWNDDGKFEDNISFINGTNSGGYVGFHNEITSVEMFVGISFISLEQAQNNLESQFPNYESSSMSPFDIIRAENQAKWEESLGTVQMNEVGSVASSDDLSVFYSALYHTYLSPTTFSESGDVYLGFDGKTHKTSEGDFPLAHFYSDLSIWDTFRTEYPWLGLSKPSVMKDVAQSLVCMYEQGGDLPRWPMASGYTNTMIGTHADIVLADTMAHGIVFDYETAYQGMYQGATESQANAGRSDIEDWKRLGYVPYDKNGNSCCDTLAYSYDDWSVSLMAKKLNKTEDAETFMQRSFNFMNVWEPSIEFMCPRYTNQSYNCPEHLLYPGDGRYVEGDAWHYRWFAPQQPTALMNLFNSTEYYVSELEQFFAGSFDDKLAPFDILPNPYYWGGNEHDLFSVYQFAYAGRIDRTQYWVRKLLARHYSNEADGLSGNDDYGALSSWAVWNYLGFFPRAGDGSYIAGIPFFQDVTITRDSGDIHIIANDLTPTAIYVSSVSINGVPLKEGPFFSIEDIKGSATIEFFMSDTPTEW